MKRKALFFVLFICFLFAVGYPLGTRSFGETVKGPWQVVDETTWTTPLVHPAFREVQIIPDYKFSDRVGEVELSLDSEPLVWTWRLGEIDFGTQAFIADIGQTLDRQGSHLQIRAPFDVHYRPLYRPQFSDRLKIIGHRLTVWRPTGFSILFILGSMIFIGIGIYLIGFCPMDSEAEINKKETSDA